MNEPHEVAAMCAAAMCALTLLRDPGATLRQATASGLMGALCGCACVAMPKTTLAIIAVVMIVDAMP